jgi:hypothetical protein
MRVLAQRLAVLLLATVGASSAGAAPAAEIGTPLPALAVKNSAGEVLVLNDGLRRIYANGDRKGDRLIKAAMAGSDQDTLDAQGAIVVADISAAPGFIRRIIRNELRERSYATWLDESGDTRTILPYRQDHITVLELDARRVIAIRHIGDVETLRQELAAPSPTPAAATHD